MSGFLARARHHVGFQIGAVLLLLFVGIHNSWDTVVYLVVDARRDNVTT